MLAFHRMLGNENFGKNLCFGRKCLFYRLNNRLDTAEERSQWTQRQGSGNHPTRIAKRKKISEDSIGMYVATSRKPIFILSGSQ